MPRLLFNNELEDVSQELLEQSGVLKSMFDLCEDSPITILNERYSSASIYCLLEFLKTQKLTNDLLLLYELHNIANQLDIPKLYQETLESIALKHSTMTVKEINLPFSGKRK